MTLANWWLQVGNYHLQGQTATCQWLFATTNWQWPNVNCHRTSRALAQLHERTTPPYYSLPSLLTPLTTDSLTHYSITTHSPHYSLTHSLLTHYSLPSLLTPLTTHSLTHSSPRYSLTPLTTHSFATPPSLLTHSPHYSLTTHPAKKRIGSI